MTLWTWRCKNCGREAATAKASHRWATVAARRHHCAPRGADVVAASLPPP